MFIEPTYKFIDLTVLHLFKSQDVVLPFMTQREIASRDNVHSYDHVNRQLWQDIHLNLPLVIFS